MRQPLVRTDVILAPTRSVWFTCSMDATNNRKEHQMPSMPLPAAPALKLDITCDDRNTAAVLLELVATEWETLGWLASEDEPVHVTERRNRIVALDTEIRAQLMRADIHQVA